jgi:hypothetical protein
MDKLDFIYQNTKLATFNSGGNLMEQGLGTNPRASHAGTGKSVPDSTGGSGYRDTRAKRNEQSG